MKEEQTTHRITLQGPTVEPEPTGGSNPAFRILAISAGEGNGWNFTSAALQASVPLWQNLECYIDHQPPEKPSARSLHDLAGICTTPTWDALREGITLTLRPVGPAADLLTQTGAEWLRQR